MFPSFPFSFSFTPPFPTALNGTEEITHPLPRFDSFLLRGGGIAVGSSIPLAQRRCHRFRPPSPTPFVKPIIISLSQRPHKKPNQRTQSSPVSHPLNLQEVISALESGARIRPKAYISLLQSCIDSGSLSYGRRLHSTIDSLTEPNPFVETKLWSACMPNVAALKMPAGCSTRCARGIFILGLPWLVRAPESRGGERLLTCSMV